jgi:hypothetical protein
MVYRTGVGVVLAGAALLVGACSSSPDEQRLEGEIREGVMPGCLLLDAEPEDYLLFSDVQDALQPGTYVAVRGTLVEDGSSGCQEGRMFEVHSIECSSPVDGGSAITRGAPPQCPER